MSKFDHSFGYFLRLIWKHQGDPVSFDQYFKVNFSYPPAHHPKLAGYGFSYETLSDVEPVSWKLMSDTKKESLNNRFLMYAILKNGSSDLRLFEVQNNLASWVKTLGTLNIPDISTQVISPLPGNNCWVGVASNISTRVNTYRIWCYREEISKLEQRLEVSIDDGSNKIDGQILESEKSYLQPEQSFSNFKNPFALHLLSIGNSNSSRTLNFHQEVIHFIFDKIVGGTNKALGGMVNGQFDYYDFSGSLTNSDENWRKLLLLSQTSLSQANIQGMTSG